MMSTVLAMCVMLFLSGNSLLARGANGLKTADKYHGKAEHDLLRYRMMITVKIIFLNNDSHARLPSHLRKSYKLLMSKSVIDDADWSTVIDVGVQEPTSIESNELIDHVLKHANSDLKTTIQRLEGMGSKNGPPKKRAHLSLAERAEYVRLLRTTTLSDADVKRAEALIGKYGHCKEGYVLFDHQLLYRPDRGNRQ